MAKIAEMAEKKNMQPRVNSVLKEVTSMVQKKAPTSDVAVSKTVAASFLINTLDTGGQKDCIPHKSSARKYAKGRRRQPKERIRSTCCFFSWFQIKKRQHNRRYNEFSREETLEAEQRRKEEREAQERRRQQEAEAPKEELN